MMLCITKDKVVLWHFKFIFSSIEANVKDMTIQSLAFEDDSKPSKSPMLREEDCFVDESCRLSNIDFVEL